MSTQGGWTTTIWLHSDFLPWTPAHSASCSLQQQFVLLREPSATNCAEKGHTSVPSLPTDTMADVAWKRLLCCRTQKVPCSAGEKVSGNNTGPLSSYLLLNFMGFKWDLRIAMLFESFPHTGGKDLISSGDWPHPTHPQETNINCWVSYSIVRLSRAGEQRACPAIHPALFETTYMQQLQKHLPLV